MRAERLVAGGDALARHGDGRIVFVVGALPGETVAIGEPTRRAGVERAAVAALVEPSPDRVEPPCPRRREGCGGCDWQHLAVAAQLPAKAGVVLDALGRIGRFRDPDVRIGGAVPAEGYRTTVRLVGGDDGRAGFRRERSHDVVWADGCLVAHPVIRQLIPSLRLSPGHEVTLRCSAATGDVVALWRPDGGRVQGLPDDVRSGPRAGITEVVHHGPAEATSSPTVVDSSLHEAPLHETPLHETSLHVSAGSFFQSGPAAAGLLVDAVTAAGGAELAGARHVADLYGGVGLFAASVVPPAAAVTIVESGRTAVADAARNVPRATVVRSDVGRWRPATGSVPVDLVVADPPRTGLGVRGVATVAATGAATVVLVSCDPVAGARDAKLLGAHGYDLDHVTVVDLFPGTHHVESVARLTRRSVRP